MDSRILPGLWLHRARPAVSGVLPVCGGFLNTDLFREANKLPRANVLSHVPMGRSYKMELQGFTINKTRFLSSGRSSSAKPERWFIESTCCRSPFSVASASTYSCLLRTVLRRNSMRGFTFVGSFTGCLPGSLHCMRL